MFEVYERDSFFWAYVKWHYSQGLRELFGVAHNFLWFVGHFFSFRLLFKTWFAPWKRLGENYSGGFDLKTIFSSLVVNSLMRIAGFISKTVILIVGFIAYILVSIFTLFIFIIWIFLPAILLGSFVLAVTFFLI
ncbi:MAG: hypothetical protein AAB446_00890 [Patescibacteria group bacterium]